MNLYILIPKKLKKHPGKMAAAIAHALWRLPKKEYNKAIALELETRRYELEDITIITDAGHTVVEPGTITCIVGYADKLQGKLL